MDIRPQQIEADKIFYTTGGKQFLLVDITSPVTLIFYNAAGKPVETAASVGQNFKKTLKDGSRFSRIGILSTIQQTITYGVSEFGDVEYTHGSSDVNSTDVVPTTFNCPADVSINATSQSLVSAANADKQLVLITNLSANTDPVRVGDNTADATHGQIITPGQTVGFPITAAIYVYNTGAGAQAVNVVELRK